TEFGSLEEPKIQITEGTDLRHPMAGRRPVTTANAPMRTRDPWIVAFCNQKGGVGKTTLALGLAATTADSSGRALVVDVDPQGSAHEIAEAAGEGALPFDFTSDTDPAELRKLRGVRDYDTVFVDCPGSLEGRDVLEEVLASAHFAIVPIIPELAAVTPTRRTAQFIAARHVPYRVLLNQVDPLRGTGPIEAAWDMLGRARLPHMRSFVRRYVAHTASQLEGVMITQYRGDRSWRGALDDMRRVQTELLLELGRLAAGEEE
ncbi:MAG: ParA family protein, partial [Isosphaeraceae bacterium]